MVQYDLARYVRGTLVFDEVPDSRLLVEADRQVEAHGIGHRAYHEAHIVGGPAELFGALFLA